MANQSQTKTMVPPKSGVKIRMYHLGGLGDCFLLAFPSKKSKVCYMLIDCGVLQGTNDADVRLRTIVEDIAQATNNTLDVLAVTHEHWDHISGFYLAKDIFEKVEVKQIWLGWTENPDDIQAKELGEKKRKVLKSLKIAANKLNSLGLGTENDRRVKAVIEILECFNGELEVDGEAPPGGNVEMAAIGRMTTPQIMDFIRGLSEEAPLYLKPGNGPLEVPGVEGARVYVLGPPTDFKWLFQSEPPKGETYGTGLALDEFTAFDPSVRFDTAVYTTLTPEEQDLIDLSLPFARAAGVDLTKLGEITDPEFGKFIDHYEKVENQWRKIDQEWLWSAETLALKLDSDTNNTSLVLAIELGKNGKVLLFPGDAQAGNWLSWRDLSWTAEGAASEKITARNLLKRTTFYKVGHHGSRNATLSKDGLDLMESADLVAMIPVNTKQAQQKGWEMPANALKGELLNRTHGRVLQADQGLLGSPIKGFKYQKHRLHGDVFWIEYTLPG